MVAFPFFGNLGEDFIVRFSEDIRFAQMVILQPAAAERQVAHLPIEHGDRRRSVLDEGLQLEPGGEGDVPGLLPLHGDRRQGEGGRGQHPEKEPEIEKRKRGRTGRE